MASAELPLLLVLGIFLLIGWGAHAIGEYLRLPRVTLLFIAGFVCGPFVLNVFSHNMDRWFPAIAHMALAMVAFLLGSNFVKSEIKERGRAIIYISLAKSIAAAVLVFCATLIIGKNLILALLLAGIAPASAPAATIDVIHETGAKGPLTKTILGVVAVDDAWGVMLFVLLLALAEALCGKGQVVVEMMKGVWDIGGAFLTGVFVGLPMSWLTGRIKKGEPTLVEASGFVFLCGGFALLMGVSYLLACMVLGAIVANFAKHHTRPFREIENASGPFLIIFFLLAGYEFDVASFQTFGMLGGFYLLARSIGFVAGGYLGAKISNTSAIVERHIGWCLFPQAGVALGFALLAMERFPEKGKSVLPLIVGTTIILELFGPVVTRWHLRRAGEY